MKSKLGDYSWRELKTISNEISKAKNENDALTIAKKYNLVDKTGKLPLNKQNTIAIDGDHEARLIGIWHDIKSGTRERAGLTFIFKTPYDVGRMRATQTNNGGWEQSSMRERLNSETGNVLGSLMDSGIDVVKVLKETNNEGNTKNEYDITPTQDYIFLLSVAEICGNNTVYISDKSEEENIAYNKILRKEGTQYKAFKDLGLEYAYSPTAPNAKRQFEQLIEVFGTIGIEDDEENTDWWLRSPSPGTKDLYRVVSRKGDPGKADSSTHDNYYSPCFCI